MNAFAQLPGKLDMPRGFEIQIEIATLVIVNNLKAYYQTGDACG